CLALWASYRTGACSASSRGRSSATASRACSTCTDVAPPPGSARLGASRLARAARGADAERTAAAHLARAGLRLLARNYRGPRGEIDLVMREGATLVFVEVRYRSRSDYGHASETVDRRKQARLRATAEHFLQHRTRCPGPCRFDIVAVT